MEKSKNFRIDALLALDVEQRTNGDGASSAFYYGRSPGGSPGSNRGSETPSPHPRTTNYSPVQLGILTKSQLLNLTQSGVASLSQEALVGVHPGSVYPLAAFGGQHPAFMCPGVTQLVQPFQEQMRRMIGTLPLEPYVSAGMMIPRLGEYGGNELSLALKMLLKFL